MLDVSPEFNRPVDRLIKEMSRKASGVRSSTFCIWQAELFESNQFIIIIIIITIIIIIIIIM
jgi:hypothetical protein